MSQFSAGWSKHDDTSSVGRNEEVRPTANVFLDDLRLEGVQILHDNGRGDFRVQVPANWTTQAFFKLAHHHNVIVRGLQPDDEDLEELFHRVIEENRGAR